MYNRIIEWFGAMRDRLSMVRDFNRASKNSFICGESLTVLEARITRGCSDYRHSLSNRLMSGFRIKALSGKPLQRSEVIQIGNVMLSNEILIRTLITYGFDTLEVHDSLGSTGSKWSLMKHANLGGLLT